MPHDTALGASDAVHREPPSLGRVFKGVLLFGVQSLIFAYLGFIFLNRLLMGDTGGLFHWLSLVALFLLSLFIATLNFLLLKLLLNHARKPALPAYTLD
jgi:hypothetical protein